MATPSDVPLRQVSLDAWSLKAVEEGLRDKPLLLQVKRASRSRGKNVRRIILLVHGLNSSATTWLSFLSHAWDAPELQQFDFGLFNYQTSLISRLNPLQRLPRPEDWAKVVANVIRTTITNRERYDSFVLVGHSMGGLVCKFALRDLLVENDATTLNHLHSLFTYGTPNHGSDKASVFGSLISPDLALLNAWSAPIHDLQTFWNTRISALPETPGRVTIHERAVISIKDFWVAPTSGISSLPEKFIQRLASSHTGLIEPSGTADPRLRWFIDELQAIQKQAECSLVAIKDGPTPDSFLGADAGVKIMTQIFQTLFVLDAGTADGVAKGDRFALYYEPTEVRAHDGTVVDTIPGAMNFIEAIQVFERTSYCKLENLAYEPALQAFHRALEEISDGDENQTFDEKQLETLFLSFFGRRAVRIPRRESDAAEVVADYYTRARDDDAAPVRDKSLRALLTASRDFLDRYPGSVLAERAAFHEAWASMKLDRWEEADALFERFCEKYPFSISVSGARGWIQEIALRIRLRDSGDKPELQLELSEHLMTHAHGVEEGCRMALDALSKKPALVSRANLATRFALVGEYIFQPLFDQVSPKEVRSALLEYGSNAEKRQEMRARIQAPGATQHGALFLDLLDGTDWTELPPSEDEE